MKKRILALVLSMVLAVSPVWAGATADELSPEDLTSVEINFEETVQTPDEQVGFPIVINDEAIDATSVICNNVHHVPLRAVFEKLGAHVFFRYRDRQILALSRDGDTIQHIVGSNIVTFNGEQKTFSNPSVSKNNSTYVPIDMISTLFRTNEISYEGDQLSIKKPFSDTDYNKLVKDVLDLCKTSNFYPERFKRYISYHSKNPTSTMNNVIFMVNLGLDYPFLENVTTIANPYSLSVLVNKYNKLPTNFSQTNLVNMDKKYTINDGKQYLMVNVAYEKFVQMAEAAKKSGLSLKAVSTYRTEDYQRRLYNKNLRATGRVNADNYSARPGFSEHQTGLAIDINSTGTSFEYTAEFKWLNQHAHEYGYILRYPKNQKWVTGYAYEPWHYRYVGVEAATIIHNEGTTYEQYYAKYIGVNEFK